MGRCGTNSLREDCSETFEMGRCGTIAQRHSVYGGKWGAKGVVQEVQAVEQGVEQRGEGVGEGFFGEDWSIGKGGAADLERERIEGRLGEGVGEGTEGSWDRKSVGGGREREKNNFLKVKNIILMI
jgi:hypothetical protein